MILKVTGIFPQDRFNPALFVVGRDEEQQAGLRHLMFNSRWMPNFSTRLRRVARVMPSSLAAWTWLPLVSLRAWMTNSRSTEGRTFILGSRRAHWKSCRDMATISDGPPWTASAAAKARCAVCAPAGAWPGISPANWLIEIASPLATTSARRMIFSSSRTLPGQWYFSRVLTTPGPSDLGGHD